MDRFYGDDSVMNNLVAYLIVGTEDSKASSLLSILSAEKIRFGIDPECPLHAREMFYKPSSLNKNIDIESVKILVANLIHSISDIGMLKPTIAIADKRRFPDPRKKVTFKSFQLDYKQALDLLKSAALLNIHLAYEGDNDKYIFYSDKVSPNDKISSKALPLAGIRRRGLMPGVMVVDPNVPGLNENKRLPQTRYEDAVNKKFYELVDVFLYVCCKHLCAQRFKDKEFFFKFI